MPRAIIKTAELIKKIEHVEACAHFAFRHLKSDVLQQMSDHYPGHSNTEVVMHLTEHEYPKVTLAFFGRDTGKLINEVPVSKLEASLLKTIGAKASSPTQ